ncbi:MAG: hypothetical protein WAN23_03420 [Candidatus Acidiferrales bacterium]
MLKMPTLDLRPMSAGEILDRTASLYRDNFVLFFGISVVPHLLLLLWNLPRLVLLEYGRRISPSQLFEQTAITLVITVVDAHIVYFFAQGATTFAVSEMYLGRKVSIFAALRRLGTRTRSLVGCTLLSGMTIFFATVLLLVPGISLACRLMVALPAAILENLSPRGAFERSFSLTRGYVKGALAIFALYFALRITAYLLILYAYRLVVLARLDLETRLLGSVLVLFANVAIATLIEPFLTIAATVFYFDLRVRKEALDLQLMLNDSGKIPAGPIGAPST